MAETTYFAIPLPGEGSQDWMTALNRALSALSEKIVQTQKPSSTDLKWGNIASGKYLIVSGSGKVTVVGGIDLGNTPVTNLSLQQGSEFPVTTRAGMIFFRTDEDAVYVRNAANDDWVPIGTLDSSAIASLGALVLTDLGAVKGSFVVANGAAGKTQRAPGVNRTVLYSDDTQTSGWNLGTVLALLGYSLAKGALPVGLGGNSAAAFTVGNNGELLMANSAEASGLQWVTFLSRLNTLLTERGQLLAGGAGGAEIIAAPASNARVLLSDADEPGGVRWAEQSELGAVPGTRTRVAGDLYLHANYI